MLRVLDYVGSAKLEGLFVMQSEQAEQLDELVKLVREGRRAEAEILATEFPFVETY